MARVPRGWDRYTLGLVPELLALGYDVVALYRGSDALGGDLLGSLPCPSLDVASRSGLQWEQIAVPAALRRCGADVYLAPSEHGVPFSSPCPVVLTVHSVTAHSYSALIRAGALSGRVEDFVGYRFRRFTPRYAYWRAQVALAAHLCVPSTLCADEVVTHLGVSRGRLTVVPLAPAPEFSLPTTESTHRRAVLSRLDIGSLYALYVGGYEPHKNVEGTLAAFAAARSALPDLQLVTIGTGIVPERVHTAAARLGLVIGRDVICCSNLRDELPALYDGAAVFISLSWRETFGLPALEAVCRGLPAVVSAWGAAPEVLRGDAECVEPCDIDSAAAALVRACRSDQSMRRLNTAALSRFTWRRSAAIVSRVCESVASGTDGARSGHDAWSATERTR